ncbi:MAG: GIY-YIG nuclease family protein [Ruminococcaceae bacterium]|nr:GIY-YIG nuclease family protein [Oscillospiraceae bacterium]
MKLEKHSDFLYNRIRGDFMSKLSSIEREIQFLYNKHNKETKYPLDIEEVKFPLYIIKILNKTTKRTKLEAKKLKIFRNKILYELRLKSWHLQYVDEEEHKKKQKDRQQKIATNRDVKYKNDLTKIKHFGIWFDTNSNIKLNRETYAKIDKKVHLTVSPFFIEYYKNNPNERSKVYENEDCTLYSDSWCTQHKQNCLKNFDLNISFFEKIDNDKFNNALSTLLKRRKNFEQIFDINELDEIEGIYVLVLDNYKQIYIGQSKNMKQRILQHWRKNKEFDRLIFGKIETSVLSIDSFGCLDTTRIFILKTKTLWELDDAEKVLIDSINKKYILNRTAGGIHGNDRFTMLEIEVNKNKRNL